MRTALLWLILLAAPPARALPQDGGPPEVEEGGDGEGGDMEGGDAGDEGGGDPGEAGKAPTAAAKPAPLPVRAAIPGSTSAVCLTLCDFRPEPGEEGERDPAEPQLLFGHLGEGRTTLSLTAEREDPKRPGAGRRDREAKRSDPPPATFEVGGVPCLVTEGVYPEAPGARQLHFHAFPAAAGWSFDLHVSAVSFAGKPAFDRAAFEAVVRTLRFGWFRRGRPDLLPPAVLEAMDAAARRAPGEARYLEEQARARPADGAVRLALGEALLAAERPEPAVGAFEKGVDLLCAGAEPPAPREARFALWLALDGAAEALLRTGKPDRARGHLARAVEIAAALGDPGLRAAAAYGLARCAGEKGDGAAAAALLAEALGLDPALRAKAKEDASFRKVRLSREFKAAVGE